MRLRLLLLSLLLSGVGTIPSWADTGTSSSTLSITPAATSGATITASDENTRDNAVSNWANAHVHSLSNTTNLGDGTAGNKQLCFDAADATDACLRWNDTANLFLIDNPTAGQFNQIATLTGTAGVIGIVVGDGTGALRGVTMSGDATFNTSSGALTIAANAVGASKIADGSVDVVDMTTTGTAADDKVLIADSASAGTWRTVTSCADTSGNHLNYTSSTNSFSCGTSSSVVATIGDVVSRTAGDVTTTSTTLVDFTGASITFTTGANPVQVGASIVGNNNTVSKDCMFNVDIDGSKVFGSGGLAYYEPLAGTDMDYSFTGVSADLTAASHTFKLQWAAEAGGTCTARCNATYACNFWVNEIND